MADPINAQIAPVVTPPATETTQAVAAPAPAQASAEIVAPTAVVPEPIKASETSPVEPAKGSPEATPTVTAAEPPKEEVKTETLLGEPEKPKPVEPTAPVVPEVKAEGQENNEGGQTEKAPPPTYEPWKLPDDVKLDDARVGEFTNLLSELELTGKADHATVQEFGQKAVDFHISEVKRVVEDYSKAIHTAWDKQKTDWKESFLKDPDIGGNRSQTTVDAARNFIRSHGGSQEQQTEFRTLMETSGLGNHPAMIRILASAYRDLAEGGSLAASRPVSAPKSKITTLYGNA